MLTAEEILNAMFAGTVAAGIIGGLLMYHGLA